MRDDERDGGDREPGGRRGPPKARARGPAALRDRGRSPADEPARAERKKPEPRAPEPEPAPQPAPQPEPAADRAPEPGIPEPVIDDERGDDLDIGDLGDLGDEGPRDDRDGDPPPSPKQPPSQGGNSRDGQGPTIRVETPGGAGVMVKDSVPETLFVFPLRRAVPFPALMMPLLLDSAEARDIVAKAEAHNGHVFLVLQKNPDQDRPSSEDLHETGVVTKILKTLKLPDGNMSAMTQGLRRARITRVVRQKPQLVAKVKEVVEIPAQGKKAESLFRLLHQQLKKLTDIQEQFDPGFATTLLNLDNPGQLADFAGGIVRKVVERQRLLDLADVEQRLEVALHLAMAEVELAEIDRKIQGEVREKAEKAQKDYFLREQLRLIRRELGDEKDPRLQEQQRLEDAIAKAGMPETARKRADEELLRLRTTPVESGEYGVIRNYLDWLVTLPWSKATADDRDLARAAKVLDEDHYGLEEVKARILEFLAVRKLKPGHQGSILCFSGPPGVGKTSLGRSIARAMGRQFWRFSLGGMRDEAEIKGHRRTYIGALPGRILQGLKTCGTNNPVVMLDEIDKIGSDYRGDPSAALLEVLDPEQNHAFLDHYLDVPFDLSKVMFLATANVLPLIHDALRDRLEIIEIPGYLLEEKVEIARRHLLPKQLDRHGLDGSQLSVPQSVWRLAIPLYTREAGVRTLDKVVQRLCRKSAFAVARGRRPPGRLAQPDLKRMLGRPKYPPDGRRKTKLPGVVQGLAWTSFGGDVLYIEATGSPGKGSVQLTGSLGDVMTESARLAISYLKSRANTFGIDRKKMLETDMHLHFPAGAIRKDGPSAGIAIACAFTSFLTGRPVPSDLAMTGELTVVGEVLPIGGVREKVLAAKNFGLKRVLLPEENRAEVEELKPELVDGLQFHYAEHFIDVFDVVFGRHARSRSRMLRRASDPKPMPKPKQTPKPKPKPMPKQKPKPMRERPAKRARSR